MRWTALWIGSLSWACGGATVTGTTGDEAELSRPHVAALSTYDASVGTLVEVYGSEFPDPTIGRTELVFTGVFDAEDGSTEAVDLVVTPRRVDPGTLRWTSFGPFANPFSASRTKVGRFEGEVSARIVRSDGSIVDGAESTRLSFKVRPSLIVEELQPASASCSGPVQRALGGAAYRLKVQAAGFEPESFTYTLSSPAIGADPIVVRHIARGRIDSVGERGDFTLPDVPKGLNAYGAILTVEASAADGQRFGSAFGLAVHRPLEIFYNGNVEIAEVYPPFPVSGCIPGGQTGRDVSYNESETETRERSFNMSWNESWLSTHTVSNETSETVGLSEQNGVGFATTNGQSFNWSLGGEVSGSVSLFDLVEAGVTVSGSRGGETSSSNEQTFNRTNGVERSSTTTETESVSEEHGTTVGGEFAWSVSSARAIGQDFGGQVIANRFGVFYRQTVRLIRRAAVVTYNQCGAPNVVADLDFMDWTWSPDLAVGTGCPPLPKSNLPAAQCLIGPCQGE
ncbi:MAG: hypothetical protein HYV07_28455 [Deltaproteobacteria bacterium]|nr:hypothetical protein [Deltaproteobacteria bacterium]